MTAIPHEIQQVIDLFQRRLALVTFGDLETAVLSRAAEEVQAAAAALAEAESAADRARAALAAKQDELALKAQRALAYARIYAEADAELAAQVEAIALPRGARGLTSDEGAGVPASLAPRRRGRPPKHDANGSLLVARAAPTIDAPAETAV
jgi:hypothetical protein